MYIIQIEPYESGARPALQEWNSKTIPEGYAICPDAFYDVFYSTTPAGFVNITVDGGKVTAMTVNQAALDAYIAEHPTVEPGTAEPTADEVLNALLGVTVNE